MSLMSRSLGSLLSLLRCGHKSGLRPHWSPGSHRSSNTGSTWRYGGSISGTWGCVSDTGTGCWGRHGPYTCLARSGHVSRSPGLRFTDYGLKMMDKRWIQWIYLIGAWEPCLGTTFGDAPLMLDDGVETDLEISLVLVT